MWRAVVDRHARFWLGVALHQKKVAEGDDILRTEFAEQPGYDLFSAAARDTLHLPSWPGAVLAPAPERRESRCCQLRWSHSPARCNCPSLPRGWSRRATATMRACPPARRAASRPNRGARSRWRRTAAAIWRAAHALPSARCSPRHLPTATAGRRCRGPSRRRSSRGGGAADAAGIERALLWALVRQESRFDPRASRAATRSGSRSCCRRRARRGARPARELHRRHAALFEPARSMRYGARYLRQLLDASTAAFPWRSSRTTPEPATCAATGARSWRAAARRSFCELATNADTQDYVRRILGFRQAYRDLKPRRARGREASASLPSHA